MEFRKDINGLRAIAVAAVVLYHLGIAPFTGGFIGVDIFFVISGFLLTSITLREIQAGTFSPRVFLMRRVRRIFPALVITTLACVVWAGHFYLPGDYRRMVRDATAVLIMRSNYVFHADTGYFAPDAKRNIFLHTWSLSLESQFYLGFAFLCTTLWPRTGDRMRLFGAVLFVMLGISSAVWCVVHTSADPLSAFYLLWCRAWEFMAGSAVAMYISRNDNQDNRAAGNLLGVLGALLIGWSTVAFNSADLYPGWRALLPVAGSVLVILAGGGFVTRLLSVPPFQFVGRISYSVYLWHWPLLLVYQERVGKNPAGLSAVILIAMAFLAGWLSYRFVELPVRQNASNRRLLVGSLTSITGIFAFAGVVSATNGWQGRLPGYLQPAAVAMENGNPRAAECFREVDGTKRTPGDFCHIGAGSGTAAPAMILWGDSFADRLQPAVETTARQLGISGIVATQGGCPPFRGRVFTGSGAEVFSGCERYSNFVFEYFARTPSIKIAVIAGDWQRYEPQHEGAVLRQIATILASRGGHVVFVASVPTPQGDLPHQWAQKQFQAGHAISEMTVSRDVQAHVYEQGQQIAAIASQVGNVIVVDPFKSLCTPNVCFTVKNDAALFSDTDHLSDAGVEYLVPGLTDAIKIAQDRHATAAAN